MPQALPLHLRLRGLARGQGFQGLLSLCQASLALFQLRGRTFLELHPQV